MKTAKKTGAKNTKSGILTSLHVQHPADLKTIKRAAKLRNESVSKFLLAAGTKEATRVLEGNCPTCGAPFHGKKSHRKAA